MPPTKPEYVTIQVPRDRVTEFVDGIAAEWPTNQNPHHRPGRAARTHLTVFIFPAVKDQLRMLGIERGRTIQAQVVEALNDYFAKHGKPETAE